MAPRWRDYGDWLCEAFCAVRTLVDTAGVASNFMRMVQIADATGIPLDARLAALSQEVRVTLNLERFQAQKALA